MPDPSVTTHADDAILERIAERAAERPQAIAMREVSGARVQRDITREALVQRARAMAQGLAAHGFARGDRVVFSVRPGIDAVCLVLAVHALGGVLVPQDPGTADALVAARMALLRPRWVVAESVLLARAGGLVARLLQHRGVRLAPLGDLATCVRARGTVAARASACAAASGPAHGGIAPRPSEHRW
jgi:acyl-coenzyme A synthetase/AMP-(fatty) acid ligase